MADLEGFFAPLLSWGSLIIGPRICSDPIASSTSLFYEFRVDSLTRLCSFYKTVLSHVDHIEVAVEDKQRKIRIHLPD